MRKFWSDSSSIGKLSVFIGLFVAAPLVVLPWYPGEVKYSLSFLIPGIGSIIVGLLICFFGKSDAESSMSWRSQTGRSSLTVLFAWFWGPLIGALPFIIGKQLRALQALFEAVSGWTTTGLSVMDVTDVPAIFLFHRSFMQYCGGLGFILMMMIFITNKQSMVLYSAEGHPDKIMPNIKRTAQAIFVLYNVCLLVGSIAYRIAGMTWFDAVCHCMCSLSTGGFSTKLNSIGEYNNLAIEIIAVILMLIGTTNFVALLLLVRGKVRTFFSISDVKFLFILLAVVIPPAAISLSQEWNIGLAEGFRKSVFAMVSSLSTTGMVNMDFAQCPQFFVGLVILMMVIGGEIGSTAGGIKISRVYVMLRLCWVQIKKKLNPSRFVEAPYYVKASGKMPIDRDLADDTTSYAVAYLVIYVIGSLLMTVTAKCSLSEAMFDFASSLSTVGFTVGITGPMTNSPTLILEMIGMMLGRLEIFIVVIGFTFGFGMLRDAFRGKNR